MTWRQWERGNALRPARVQPPATPGSGSGGRAGRAPGRRDMTAWRASRGRGRARVRAPEHGSGTTRRQGCSFSLWPNKKKKKRRQAKAQVHA